MNKNNIVSLLYVSFFLSIICYLLNFGGSLPDWAVIISILIAVIGISISIVIKNPILCILFLISLFFMPIYLYLGYMFDSLIHNMSK